MNSISAEEVLKLICFQWASTKDIMKLGNVGEGRALKIKREISEKLLEKGYVLPRNKVPMESIVKYFKINIDYLRKVTEERIDENE